MSFGKKTYISHYIIRSNNS